MSTIKIKKFPIMVSSRFFGSHPKNGQLTNFQNLIINGTKIHTIRSNFDFWNNRVRQIQDGKGYLAIKTWSGSPYHSKTIDVARIDHSCGIGIEPVTFDECELSSIRVGGVQQFLDDVANNDGLTVSDFISWFKGFDLSQQMALIHFTPFRYSE